MTTTQNKSVETVTNIALQERTLAINWGDGHSSHFHSIWLRDNCPCPECRHPNGQRLVETISIPLDIRPISIQAVEAGQIKIVWDDGHVSHFSPHWLRTHCYSASERSKRTKKQPSRKLWTAESMATLPEASYPNVLNNDSALQKWLTMIRDYGFAFLHDVPTTLGAIEQVVERFGYIRETNYGKIMDIKWIANPNNVAYTSLALDPHTDNPYRHPVPTLQLLHCLSSEAMGGESILVDGFQVAERLRLQAPNHFKLLSTQPVSFQFHDQTTELRAETPIICLDSRGELAAVRFNNYVIAPFDLEADLIEPFYEAYCTFERMLNNPDIQVRFKLEPGDLYIVDNERVLHGRTKFFDANHRHLRVCYADRDGLYSKLNVLNRSL
jgi:gamma-butyrobetaine hydroxylase